jgi:hypothetical protein
VGQLLHEGQWIRTYGMTQAEVRDWLLEKRKEIAGGLDVHAPL